MSEPTIEREDGGPDEYICDDCATIYPFASLNPMQSYSERVSAGGVVPAGECPDEDCGALCYPVKIEPEVAPAATADETLQLLRQVAVDAADLFSCNCGYTVGRVKHGCNGTCTHSMAERALQQLQARTEAPTTHYARVVWTADDVQTLRPELSEAQATAFLERNEKHLRDRLIEQGWDVMETLLEMDGDELQAKGGL